MREKSADRMRRILNGTNGYKLTGDSPADWELDACGAGLDRLEQEIDLLLGDLFADTASAERLDRWDRLFRTQPSEGTLEERQAILRERFAMNPGKFRVGEFSPMLPAAGVVGEVKEAPNGLQVVVGKQLGLGEAEIRRELEEILPAHLPWEWLEAMNWVKLDAWAPDFAVLDSWGLTWAEFDGLTQDRLRELARQEAAAGSEENLSVEGEH